MSCFRKEQRHVVYIYIGVCSGSVKKHILKLSLFISIPFFRSKSLHMASQYPLRRRADGVRGLGSCISSYCFLFFVLHRKILLYLIYMFKIVKLLLGLSCFLIG